MNMVYSEKKIEKLTIRCLRSEDKNLKSEGEGRGANFGWNFEGIGGSFQEHF